MTLLSIIGLLGGACFAYCGVPAAWSAYQLSKTDDAPGTPLSVALMIALGGILMYVYLTAMHGFDIILAVNYAVEVASWLAVVVYHAKASYGWTWP